MLNANTHTQHERRLRIVRATEKEDDWNKADEEEGKAGSGAGEEEGEAEEEVRRFPSWFGLVSAGWVAVVGCMQPTG